MSLSTFTSNLRQSSGRFDEIFERIRGTTRYSRNIRRISYATRSFKATNRRKTKVIERTRCQKILNEITIEDVEKEIDESEAIDIKITIARERIERARKQHATPQHSIVENSQHRNEHGPVAMAT
jgi:hypothetical protein